MAYRTNTQEITDVALAEMNEAERLGKPLLLSVETLQNPDSFITFHGKGKKNMNKVMEEVDNKLRNRNTYKGYAVHDFSGWGEMEDD